MHVCVYVCVCVCMCVGDRMHVCVCVGGVLPRTKILGWKLPPAPSLNRSLVCVCILCMCVYVCVFV